MLADSKLLEYLQESFAATAVYLHNRSPSKPLRGITLYKKRYNKCLDLLNLRILGSKAYIYIPKERQLNKLAPRSKICYFIGYTNAISNYRLYNLSRRRILISRDIIFDKNPRPIILPSNEQSPNEESEFNNKDNIPDIPSIEYSLIYYKEPLKPSKPRYSRH